MTETESTTWPLLWPPNEDSSFNQVDWGTIPELIIWATKSQSGAAKAFDKEDDYFAVACATDAQRCLFLAFRRLLQELQTCR